MPTVVTRQVRGKWQFGKKMPDGSTMWFGGSYSSEKNAHRAAEDRIAGYIYEGNAK